MRSGSHVGSFTSGVDSCFRTGSNEAHWGFSRVKTSSPLFLRQYSTASETSSTMNESSEAPSWYLSTESPCPVKSNATTHASEPAFAAITSNSIRNGRHTSLQKLPACASTNKGGRDCCFLIALLRKIIYPEAKYQTRENLKFKVPHGNDLPNTLRE